MAHPSVSTMLRTSITTLLRARAEPTFWESLSPHEQNDSKDTLLPEMCCGRPAWTVKGKLRDFWNTKVHRTIISLCAENYRRIYRKGGHHAWCTYHVYLLGQQQAFHVWPTIIIRTKDKAVARRTKKLLMKHEIYKDLNTGFEIESDTRETLGLAGHMLTQDLKDPLLQSLCGARVIIGPLSTGSGSEWRRATITVTLLLDGKFYALLPAHVFFDNQTDEMEDGEEGETSNEDSDLDISPGNSPNAFRGGPKSMDDRQLFETIFAPLAVYLDVSSKKEGDDKQDRVLALETPLEILRIGSLRHQQPYSIADSGDRHLASTQLDWMLVEIENNRFRCDNLVFDKSGPIVRPWFSGLEDGRWEDPVVVVAGMSGVHNATLSGSACSITPPWGTVPLRAWELRLVLAPGDSGALVLRKDGFFLGMAIAASPTASSTYVLPSEDLLDSIMNRWPTKQSLEEILPRPQPTAQRTDGRQFEDERPPDINQPYLNDRVEVLYMQVFVEEVGVWMDSMDRDKHFSHLIPFQALREPMLKYAILACGARHLTLVNPAAYPESHPLDYYTSAMQLLIESLQNPGRDSVQCATTATILNAYEIMSELPLQTMNHITGARALIKECRWDATTIGIGSACFWLNVGLELFSCLRYHWGVAWDPDTWGIDMTMNPQHIPGNEEDWTHKMLWILSKITNFRSTAQPRFQETMIDAEQVWLHRRHQQWLNLKQLCDRWHRCVPPTMRTVACVPAYATSSKSCFPEVWLIKRTTIVASLFYHTAMVLLGSLHPLAKIQSQTATNMKDVTVYHSRQICGLVAHVKDRGVASASIVCLSIAGENLFTRREQEEALQLFDKIKQETGWRIANIQDDLKEKWGWNSISSPSTSNLASSSLVPSTQPTTFELPKIPSDVTNPLYKDADFSAQSPPYESSYVPPASRSIM